MARVFVGNLPEDVRERDLEKRFQDFGRIQSVKVKFPPRPPPFAFIEFDHRRDADDAVREMHNADFNGSKIRVEVSHNREDRTGGPRGTQHRVILQDLPTGMSWQDLKDFLRAGGDVVHTDVDGRGSGAASFATSEEMERAIEKLDGEEVEGQTVRIRRDRGDGGFSMNGSQGPRGRGRRRRSPSKSRSRSRSRDRGNRSRRSRSPRPRHSRSRSRSDSRH